MASKFEWAFVPGRWSFDWSFSSFLWLSYEILSWKSLRDFMIKILWIWRAYLMRCLLLSLSSLNESFASKRILRWYSIIDIDSHQPHHDFSYTRNDILRFLVLNIEANMLQNFQWQMIIWYLHNSFCFAHHHRWSFSYFILQTSWRFQIFENSYLLKVGRQDFFVGILLIESYLFLHG